MPNVGVHQDDLKIQVHAHRAKMLVKSGPGPWIQGPWTPWVGWETGFLYSKETTNAPALAGWSSYVLHVQRHQFHCKLKMWVFPKKLDFTGNYNAKVSFLPKT